MDGKTGRPKSKKGPKANIVRSFSCPANEFEEWDIFLKNMRDLGISGSEFIWGKIKKANKELKKEEIADAP